MKHARVLALCSLGALIAPGLWAQAPRELKLGTATVSLGSTASVALTMNSNAQVQGVVAAADWNAALLEGVDLIPGAVIKPDPNGAADVVVRRVAKTFFALGVVMDSDGQDGEIIPPGNNIALATLRLTCLGPATGANQTSPVTFQDGKYRMTDTSPVLDNIFVIGGLSVGKAEGLVLTNGSVVCTPPPPGKLTIDTANGNYNFDASVRVLMGNSSAVAGFVTAITHPPALTLKSIGLGSAVPANPDFVQAELFPAKNGGTMGVVMELDGQPPFRTIPVGTANHICSYVYRRDGCSEPTNTYNLTFADNVLGDPVKENVIVVGTASINPELVNGSLTLSVDRTRPPCGEVPQGEITFAAGGCSLVGEKDAQVPGPVEFVRGTTENPATFGVGLWYLSPEDGESNEAAQTDHIQGVSMAICYDLTCVRCVGTYSLKGTITEAVGAEFVNVDCDDDSSDGDPGEVVVGILVDALPPFDGKDLPPTDDYLKLICLDFVAGTNASCDTCATGIRFCDADGNGDIVIKNLASVMNHPVVPKTVNGQISFAGENAFIRGDCNGLDTSYPVDISDAASVISFLFYTGTWKFTPPCIKACDANDDGRVDLADSVFILRFLFKAEGLTMKPPYPNAGSDPTVDKLTCGDPGEACE
jgi:hypothetical protein